MKQKEEKTPKRILIVDDDELNSTAFAKRLERRGFHTKFVKDAKLALEVIAKEKFDLILLDIVMPEIDGISLLKQIRSKHSSEILPVIMVTVMDDSSDIFDAFEGGASDYITKPVNVDAAVSRIKGQLSVVELNQERIKKKELEAINAMVVTCHHEINNPLAIAKSELQLLAKNENKIDQEKLTKALEAINRIGLILKKIQEVSEKSEISYDLYENKTKMVKLGNGRK